MLAALLYRWHRARLVEAETVAAYGRAAAGTYRILMGRQP